MRLDSFDLNLLVALNVLLEERSVTRAARRMNLTQPAMSASLRRLREAFQDDLFVLHGKKMVPTQRALELEPDIRALIQQLRGVIAAGSDFDPATSRRLFRIGASDYITTVLMAPLLRRMQQEAPNVRLEFFLPDANTVPKLEAGDIDLHISPDVFMEGDHPRELLFEEDHVIVGCASNPLFDRAMTEHAFLEASHIAVRLFDRHTFVENILENRFPDRRVEVIAQSFVQPPWLVKNTRHVTVMYRRLAEAMAPILGLRIAELPFDLPVMRQTMQNHTTRNRDAGLIWLKAQLHQVVAGT